MYHIACQSNTYNLCQLSLLLSIAFDLRGMVSVQCTLLIFVADLFMRTDCRVQQRTLTRTDLALDVRFRHATFIFFGIFRIFFINKSSSYKHYMFFQIRLKYIYIYIYI